MPGESFLVELDDRLRTFDIGFSRRICCSNNTLRVKGSVKASWFVIIPLLLFRSSVASSARFPLVSFFLFVGLFLAFLFISFDQIFAVQIFFWLPSVIFISITLPF